MKIAIISARYLEQHAIEAYFKDLFGPGQARVTVGLHKTVCNRKY